MDATVERKLSVTACLLLQTFRSYIKKHNVYKIIEFVCRSAHDDDIAVFLLHSGSEDEELAKIIHRLTDLNRWVALKQILTLTQNRPKSSVSRPQTPWGLTASSQSRPKRVRLPPKCVSHILVQASKRLSVEEFDTFSEYLNEDCVDEVLATLKSRGLIPKKSVLEKPNVKNNALAKYMHNATRNENVSNSSTLSLLLAWTKR